MSKPMFSFLRRLYRRFFVSAPQLTDGQIEIIAKQARIMAEHRAPMFTIVSEARKKGKGRGGVKLFRWFKNMNGQGRGFSGCSKCKDSWSWKTEHTTYFHDGSGCFPLCEECWQQATRRDIIHYYSDVVWAWRRSGSYYTPEEECWLVNWALKEKGFKSDWPMPSNMLKEAQLHREEKEA